MTLIQSPPGAPTTSWTEHPFVRAVVVVLLLYLFLVGVKGLGLGFRGLGGDVASSFFSATENPWASKWAIDSAEKT